MTFRNKYPASSEELNIDNLMKIRLLDLEMYDFVYRSLSTRIASSFNSDPSDSHYKVESKAFDWKDPT